MTADGQTLEPWKSRGWGYSDASGAAGGAGKEVLKSTPKKKVAGVRQRQPGVVGG